MRLKGVNEINNILNNFLEPFDCTVCIGEDFCYWSAKSLIQYALVVPSNSDKWFQEFASELMPEVSCDTFLLSFFHELGHHETIDDIDDATYSYCMDMKAELNTRSDISDREINFRYFNLPDEKMATKWGLQYMLDHSTEVAELWKKLQPAIMHFYKVNRIH